MKNRDLVIMKQEDEEILIMISPIQRKETEGRGN